MYFFVSFYLTLSSTQGTQPKEAKGKLALPWGSLAALPAPTEGSGVSTCRRVFAWRVCQAPTMCERDTTLATVNSGTLSLVFKDSTSKSCYQLLPPCPSPYTHNTPREKEGGV